MSDPAPAAESLLLLLQGGLGNQLFQVVLARTLAERFGRRLVVDTRLLSSRLRRLRGVTPRALSPLVAQLLPEIKPTPWHHRAGARLAARRAGRSLHWALNDAGLAQASAGGEPLDWLGAIRLLRTHATHPALYGASFEPAWRSIATTLQPLAAREAPGLAVHVRRGDYLNRRSGFFPLQVEYYRRALARFQGLPGLSARAGLPGAGASPVLHLFTDDPDWCRTHLNGTGWALRIEAGSPEHDLARLSAARALILSNSSFSAVAAHLARLRDPTTPVICPNRWLLKEDGRLGDLRGPDWLAVEA